MIVVLLYKIYMKLLHFVTYYLNVTFSILPMSEIRRKLSDIVDNCRKMSEKCRKNVGKCRKMSEIFYEFQKKDSKSICVDYCFRGVFRQFGDSKTGQ